MSSLRIDFFDSGKGDTTVITFPSGAIGIVDAHPSPSQNRPSLLDITRGKRILFVCLTHPHEDHGADLVSLVENHPEIDEFWHTVSDVSTFVNRMLEVWDWRGGVLEDSANQIVIDQATFVTNLFDAVRQRGLPQRKLHSGIAGRTIEGVEIFFLSPEEDVLNEFTNTYISRLDNPAEKNPSPNLLSSILALRYGENVVLLGADALKATWAKAIKLFQKLRLQKAVLLKVPHHGARNAIYFGNKISSYLDLCSTAPKVKAVVMAGDSKHPAEEVFERLRSKTDSFCSANLPLSIDAGNPLKIRNLQFRAVRQYTPGAPFCNAQMSFEVGQVGPVKVLNGLTCDECVLGRS